MVAYQGALLAPFSITRSKDEAGRRALEVLERLKKGEAWDALAKKYSDDKSTSASGGDLGIIPLNIIPTELEGVAFTFFDAQDVVRHPLVQRIVQAYESRGGAP